MAIDVETTCNRAEAIGDLVDVEVSFRDFHHELEGSVVVEVDGAKPVKIRP